MIAPTASSISHLDLTRRSSAVSMSGLIGCYFGTRVCLTFLLFRADPQAGTIAGLALNLLFLVPAFFYTIGPASMILRQALRVSTFRFILLYLGYSLASLAWSATQSRGAAVGYWSALAADVLLVFLALRSTPGEAARDSLLKGFVSGACLMAVIAWAAPGTADLRLGDDEFFNPNAIGYECAFAALLCHYLARDGARWKWAGTFLTITLFRSLSKTSIVAFLVAETYLFFRDNTMRRSTKLVLLLGVVVIAAAFWTLFSAYYIVYTNAGDQAETLTGRTGIWLVTFGFITEQPWFGHGLHSFRAILPAFGEFEPWHAHNELIQLLFAYGVVGVAIVACLYGSFFRLLRRIPRTHLTTISTALLLLVLVRGLADTERFDLSFPLWALTALSLTSAIPATRSEFRS